MGHSHNRSVMICLAGFGDGPDLFDPLLDTSLGKHVDIVAEPLPGFGAPALQGETSLYTLANHVRGRIKETGARYLLAHSVASIIAALATANSAGQIKRIFSLEGNLTVKDAYFSGKAAQYPSPDSFRNSFLHKLEEGAVEDKILQRYWQRVAEADKKALWELGCSAHAYSISHIPGDELQATGPVTYFYNPENIHALSKAYLERSSLDEVLMVGASHWPTLDQPTAVAEAIVQRIR